LLLFQDLPAKLRLAGGLWAARVLRASGASALLWSAWARRASARAGLQRPASTARRWLRPLTAPFYRRSQADWLNSGGGNVVAQLTTKIPSST
jgi:hypothetical protein